LMQGKESDKSGNTRNLSRVLVYKLGGKVTLPPLPPELTLLADPPPAVADAATVATGKALFDRFCGVCHGEAAVGGASSPTCEPLLSSRSMLGTASSSTAH
jgi:quinohemoprotein ethanol dehydrogenase